MLRLVGSDVSDIEEFMRRYRVGVSDFRMLPEDSYVLPLEMDNPAALHRIKVGVPATVEHSSEAGPETGKWIAETTQAGLLHKL